MSASPTAWIDALIIDHLLRELSHSAAARVRIIHQTHGAPVFDLESNLIVPVLQRKPTATLLDILANYPV